MNILLVDDHAVVREGVKQILSMSGEEILFGEATSERESLDLILAQEWNIVVLDISLPRGSGLDVLKKMKRIRPEVPVLILSIHSEEQYAIRAMKAGAAGYLTKETAPKELRQAVQEVVSGGKYISKSLADKLAVYISSESDESPHESLSDREFQVLRLIGSGKTPTEIADELSLSVQTVSTYRRRVLLKMNMRTSAELVTYAIKNDLTP